MLPTPSTSHVPFTHIYEPAEDSFLLLDTLSSSSETFYLRDRFPVSSAYTPVALEVGTGSGVVLAFVTAHAKTIFGREDVITLGVDVNWHACTATGETVQRACKDIESNEEGTRPGTYGGNALGDLMSAIKPGSVDVVIFNPPYVPTPELPAMPEVTSTPKYSTISQLSFDEESNLLALSYAGGEDGMEVTNRLLDQLSDILSGNGVAYILLCAQNKPTEVARRFEERWGGVEAGRWAIEIVGRSGKVGGWEKLCILRIARCEGVEKEDA